MQGKYVREQKHMHAGGDEKQKITEQEPYAGIMLNPFGCILRIC